MTGFEVIFKPYGRTVKVKDGETLLRAAIEAGVYLKASCGGGGTCGGCKVAVKEGKFKSTNTAALSNEDAAKGLVLACQSTVHGKLIVEVPEGSHSKYLRMPDRESLVTGPSLVAAKSTKLEDLFSTSDYEPLVKCLKLEIEPPSKSDNSSDLHRLRREIERSYGYHSIDVDFSAVKKLGGILRRANWRVTAVVLDGPKGRKVIDIRPGLDDPNIFAAVFDIGTTSVYSELLRLADGEVVASVSEYNPQISFGEDVISRIVFSQKPGGLDQLQRTIADLMNSMIISLAGKGNCSLKDIYVICVAGNTTMTHLLLGVDPKSIREEPYVPTARFFPSLRPIDVGIELPDCATMYVFPSVASYVGGDVVAGLVSAGILDDDQLTLYMDIGTNGEVVLGNKEWMMSASCSAGPAFEGGGVKHGMRASDGAIEDVEIDPITYEPYLKTISDFPPVGICGSGLIDLASELLNAGIITQAGKFNEGVESGRVRKTDGGFEYVLANSDETGDGKEITITDVDVDNLIRAKAAMYAGVTVLVESLGFSFDEIERVLIAGGFGQYIDVDKAQKIGLLPGIPKEKFLFIGNGSLNGARLLARSKAVFEIADKVTRMVTNIELSDNPSFMDQYIAALFLPHTNTSLFLQTNAGRKTGVSL